MAYFGIAKDKHDCKEIQDWIAQAQAKINQNKVGNP
jgi:hypothetical protein